MLQKDRKPTRRKAAPKPGAAAVTPQPVHDAAAARPGMPARATVPAKATVPAADPLPRISETPVRRAVTAEERARMVAEAAYFRAQSRGFRNGDPVRDWAEAEAEIDAMLLHSR
jgi:hypothetical protein